jgi:hypothetical protein
MGGGAWAGVDEHAFCQNFSASGALIAAYVPPAQTLSGYVAGGAIEWAPWDSAPVKIEGDWYNFGNNPSLPGTCVGGFACAVGTQTPGGGLTSKDTAWEIKAGLNIRFNGLALAGAH